jgi:hypothetical protein
MALGIMTNYTADCAEFAGPKGRAPTFRVLIREGETVVFDSSSISLRVKTEAAASLLAGAVIRSLTGGISLSDLAGDRGNSQPFTWVGDLNDDCTAAINGISVHAEHLSGPLNGGVWFWSVPLVAGSVDHPDLEPKNSRAARWLCELFALMPN